MKDPYIIKWVHARPEGRKKLLEAPMDSPDDPMLAEALARIAAGMTAQLQPYILRAMSDPNRPRDMKPRTDFVYSIEKTEPKPAGGSTVTVAVWYVPQEEG